MARDPAETGGPPPRIGIFGGTFDPPHRGHVTAARDVADALQLDRVLWIPCGAPPHKARPDLTPARIRLEMAQAAAEADPRFQVCDVELRREGPSYTVDTLRELRRRHPEGELFLIIGQDEYEVFDTWRAPEDIVRLATLVVLNRGAERPEARHAFLPPERVRFVRVTPVELSATDVRARVAAGESVEGDVPPGVWAVIRREGLYAGRPAPTTGAGEGDA